LREGPPLIVARSEHGNFLASDITAILEHTRDVFFLDDGEMAVITRGGIDFRTFDGKLVKKIVERITWDPITAQKGGYKHFMLKEIHEQPHALRDTIRGKLDFDKGDAYLAELDILGVDYFKKVNDVYIVACGTAWHACLVGKFLMERYTDLRVEVDYGSEFRYRDPKIGPDDLFIAVSQSGETADTLASLRCSKARGCKVVSIVNVVGSTVARESDGVIYTHAGPEIGVASTKAFTTQIVCLFLLAVKIARARGTMSAEKVKGLLQMLLEIPQKVQEILDREDEIKEICKPYVNRQDFLYLGRGINYPIALEGALKLKEISYIHAEGYPGGEMKHGPIALIDEKMPTVALCNRNAVYEKMISNIMEVRARDGEVIVIAEEGDKAIADKAEKIFHVPTTDPDLMPILLTIPLQLIAYHIAVWRGCDVDQPRNLAKSVTVE
jgi:glucosamine--fructose-6-phosphate aminotransferase (isomerizing)